MVMVRLLLTQNHSLFSGVDATAEPRHLYLGYRSRQGGGAEFGHLGWTSWTTIDGDIKTPVDIATIGIDFTEGAGNGNSGEVVISTRGGERNAQTFAERVRIADDKTTFSGQIRNATTSSTVAYLESTTGAASIKLNSTDQDWWIGPNNFGFCIYDESDDQKKFVFDSAGNFIVSNGQVQTDTITTKDAASGDASIVLSDGAIYVAGTDINETESPKLYFRGHTSSASSVANLGYIQATVEDGSSYKGTLGFWSAIGGAPYYREEPDFSINSSGQLHAATTYEPADDNSLVTKGWVQANGASGNLPISSVDGNVTLDGESNTFTVKTNKTDQLTVDSQGRIQFQSTSGGNVLGDSDFSTYLQFNLTSGEAYKDKNIMLRAGQSYVVVNSDATVRLVNNAKLKGAADDSAELAFPSSGAATISTGGAERVTVQADGKVGMCSTAKGMGSLSGGLKVGTDASIGLQNVVYGKNANSYGFFVGVNLDMESATQFVAYQSQQPQNYAGADASLTKYIDFNSTDATAFVKEQYGFYSNVASRNDTDGSPLVRYQFYASTTAPSYFGGDVQTSRLTGIAANDASIELGANATISTGGETRATFGNNANSLLRLNSCAGWTAAAQYGCVVNPTAPAEATSFASYRSSPNLTTKTGTLYHYVTYATNDVAEQYGFYYGVSTSQPLKVGIVGFRANHPDADYAFYADQPSVPSYFNGDIQCKKLVGATAPNSDASIELGANFTATAGSAFFEMRAGGNCGIGTSGETLKAKFDVKGTIAAKPTATIDKVGSGIPTIINRSMTDGGVYSGITFFQDVDAVGISIASRSKLIISEDDIRAVDSYTPTQPNSIATRGWVESVVGSGGSVNPDTVPGTGATARWEEQSVDVSNIEPNQQVYGALYSYNGIFTDGLHWTSDGYQWNTSDPSQRNAPLNAYVGRDDGKVVKGNGNEYITSRHISNDMKSWRAINTYCDKPFYIDGEFYAENGSKKYDRSANSWVTSTAFGGTLSAGTPKNVASQESGLFVLAIHTDGSVHWSIGLDGPSAWQQDARISGANCCTFIERMGKWLIIGESEFTDFR